MESLAVSGNRAIAGPGKGLGSLAKIFRPCRACSSAQFPRLAPWAAFFRHFAAVDHWRGRRGTRHCRIHATSIFSSTKLLVRFVCPREFERVRDGGLSFFDGGDDVGTADPVGFGEIGLGPLRGMVGVGVVETDDVLAAITALSLDADQFLGVDVVAVVGRVGAGVAAACGAGDDSRAVILEASEQNSAAFVGIGFFAVLTEGVVVGAFEILSIWGSGTRSKSPLLAKPARNGAPSATSITDLRSVDLRFAIKASRIFNPQSEIKNLNFSSFSPEALAQVLVAGIAENRDDDGFLISLQTTGRARLSSVQRRQPLRRFPPANLRREKAGAPSRRRLRWRSPYSGRRGSAS